MARMGISTEILGISVCSSFRSSRPGQNLGSQQTSFIFMEVFIGKFTTHPERPRSFCVDLPAPQRAIFHRRWLCIFGHLAIDSGHGRGLAEGRSHWIHAQENGFEVGARNNICDHRQNLWILVVFPYFPEPCGFSLDHQFLLWGLARCWAHGWTRVLPTGASEPAGWKTTWGCALRVEVLVGGHTQYQDMDVMDENWDDSPLKGGDMGMDWNKALMWTGRCTSITTNILV